MGAKMERNRVKEFAMDILDEGEEVISVTLSVKNDDGTIVKSIVKRA